jgi:cytochrome c-type biogenesis protein CcmF
MIFIGISGNAFNQETKAELAPGETLQIKNFELTCQKISDKENPNFSAGIVELTLHQNGNFIKKLYPEKRFYKASEQPTSEVAIHSTPLQDLYVVFAALSENQQKALIQVYLNPLVSWVWIGGLVIIFGTLILLLPQTSLRLQAAPQIPISVKAPS